MIDEGTRLATQALTHHPPNSWSVQAAIAALHDEAPSAQQTDWRQVRLLYDELFATDPDSRRRPQPGHRDLLA